MAAAEPPGMLAIPHCSRVGCAGAESGDESRAFSAIAASSQITRESSSLVASRDGTMAVSKSHPLSSTTDRQPKSAQNVPEYVLAPRISGAATASGRSATANPASTGMSMRRRFTVRSASPSAKGTKISTA